MPIQKSQMLLGNCTVILTDLSYILASMQRVTRKMVLDRNTTLSALVLCDLDCYSMQLLWYHPFLFYTIMMSKKTHCRSVVIQVLPLNSLVQSFPPLFVITILILFIVLFSQLKMQHPGDTLTSPETLVTKLSGDTVSFYSKQSCHAVKLIYIISSQVHKLLKRNLHTNFPDNSIYTWFPMSTPTFMKSNKNLPPQPAHPWNFERPV